MKYSLILLRHFCNDEINEVGDSVPVRETTTQNWKGHGFDPCVSVSKTWSDSASVQYMEY